MKEIMIKAWAIYRTLTEGTHREKLSAALKAAWAEVKADDEKSGIDKLMDMGANRWTKGGHDRLYLSKIGAEIMGLDCDYYKTGRVNGATLNGEKISNADACRVMSAYANAYIDLKDGTLHGVSGRYAEDFSEKIAAYIA